MPTHPRHHPLRRAGPTATTARWGSLGVLVLAVATALLVAACGGGGGGASALGESAEAYGYSGALLSDPVPRPSLHLTTTEGEPYDFATETQGELALLFFGYTSCPDVCPVHLEILGRALEDLRGPGADVTVVFVGTDPARDTPEVVREFLDTFDRDFVGLVGTPDELDAATAEMGLAPITYTEPDDEGRYAAVHPSQIWVFTPDDRSHIVYTFGTRAQQWVDDLPGLATETWDGRDEEAAT